jgi:hypothetical protein
MHARAADRVHLAARDLVLSGVCVAVVGLLAHALSWVLLVGAVGPTAYVFAAHPDAKTTRLTNALIGHATAILVALATVACFGLWDQRLSLTGQPNAPTVASAAIAVGVTVCVLDLMGRHHAPAAATAVLVSTTLIPPLQPVAELAAALAAVSVVGSVGGSLFTAASRTRLGRLLPCVRKAATRESPPRRHRADRC